MDLNKLYAARFPEKDLEAKDAVWKVLCEDFFQRMVKESDTVLDLGAGYGEFLRHIRCASRIAGDWIISQASRSDSLSAQFLRSMI